MSFGFPHGWTTHPPASAEALSRLLKRWNEGVPDELLKLLRQSDGASFEWITFWPAAEIAEDGYRADEFGPHLIFFGTDGGGELFAFDLRSTPAEIAMVHSISDWKNDTFPVARDMPHLIDRIAVSMANETSLLAPWS